jgi:hypothetical protein
MKFINVIKARTLKGKAVKVIELNFQELGP